MENIQRSLAQHGFVRAQQGKVLGGVCAGLAKKWHTDPWATRLIVAVVLVAMLARGPFLLAYALAWFVMPSQRRAAELLGDAGAGTPAAQAPAAQVHDSAYASATQSNSTAQYPM